MFKLNKYDNLIEFSSLQEKLKKLKEWKLISNKATEIKPIMYKGSAIEGENVCEIIGYISKETNLKCIDRFYETVIIKVNEKIIKINPMYLKQMQSKNFDTSSLDEE